MISTLYYGGMTALELTTLQGYLMIATSSNKICKCHFRNYDSESGQVRGGAWKSLILEPHTLSLQFSVSVQIGLSPLERKYLYLLMVILFIQSQNSMGYFFCLNGGLRQGLWAVCDYKRGDGGGGGNIHKREIHTNSLYLIYGVSLSLGDLSCVPCERVNLSPFHPTLKY